MSKSPGSVRAVVQARMSSRRFPGKVLAPLHGEPLVSHVVRAARAAVGADAVVVATSVEASDDPLAAFLKQTGVPVFRGPLDDVFERFRLCVFAYPCDWVMRVCADSPAFDPQLARRVTAAAADGEWDVVTTIFPRTHPHGQTVELLRVSTLLAIDPDELNADDREHVTPFFYRHPERFAIQNIESDDPGLGLASLVVDTVEDLLRLEESRT